MNVHVFVVPYDSGMHGVRMGAGPAHLWNAGIAKELEAAGHQVQLEQIDPVEGAPLAEIRTAFELMRALANGVRAARAEGSFPIVLAGNCNTAVGTLAGLGAPAVVWFDAHGDFNTPETTTSGFLDGMALGVVTGRCWGEMAASVPGFRPIPERRVLLFGARDFDPLERSMLDASEITLLPPAEIGSSLDRCLERLKAETRDVYLHIDLDVLDSSEGHANSYVSSGGLRLEEMRPIVRRVARDFRVQAVAFAAYDPACDRDGRIGRAASSLLQTIVATTDARRTSEESR